MFMHSVWSGESQMLHVPLVWNCLIMYGLTDKERMDFSKLGHGPYSHGRLAGIFIQ